MQPTRELQALDVELLAKSLWLLGQQSVDLNAFSNVLELGPSQRKHRAEREFLVDFFVDGLGDTDGVRLRQGLEPRGHVYAVAKHITVSLDNVAKVNANTNMNLFSGVLLGIVSLKLVLDELGALHGMHDGGEVNKEGVADGFDDVAVVRSGRLM